MSGGGSAQNSSKHKQVQSPFSFVPVPVGSCWLISSVLHSDPCHCNDNLKVAWLGDLLMTVGDDDEDEDYEEGLEVDFKNINILMDRI
jgi:hypothetical protein